MCWYSLFCFFFFKQKTAYEMRISDWSSDVCSSDLHDLRQQPLVRAVSRRDQRVSHHPVPPDPLDRRPGKDFAKARIVQRQQIRQLRSRKLRAGVERRIARAAVGELRSEEHTSVQSLMRTSYAVFCLTNTNTKRDETSTK